MPHVGVKYRAITLRGASQPMSDIESFMESTKYLPCMDAVTQGICYGKLGLYIWERSGYLFTVFTWTLPLRLNASCIPMLAEVEL